jgi:hypothetical protein
MYRTPLTKRDLYIAATGVGWVTYFHYSSFETAKPVRLVRLFSSTSGTERRALRCLRASSEDTVI